MISVTGGKWTTYRRMAQEVIDLAIDKNILPAAACRTESLALHGAKSDSADYYGSDSAEVARLRGAQNVLVEASGLTEAQVRFAARSELARCVEDVLARRNRALFLDAAGACKAAPATAKILAEELGRSASWEAEQVRAFNTFAQSWRLS
jgi:glycerol-3-phosphate dehydrogenase